MATNPMHQFEVYRIGPEIKLGSIDISFTNASLFMAISSLAILMPLPMARPSFKPALISELVLLVQIISTLERYSNVFMLQHSKLCVKFSFYLQLTHAHLFLYLEYLFLDFRGLLWCDNKVFHQHTIFGKYQIQFH